MRISRVLGKAKLRKSHEAKKAQEKQINKEKREAKVGGDNAGKRKAFRRKTSLVGKLPVPSTVIIEQKKERDREQGSS